MGREAPRRPSLRWPGDPHPPIISAWSLLGLGLVAFGCVLVFASLCHPHPTITRLLASSPAAAPAVVDPRAAPLHRWGALDRSSTAPSPAADPRPARLTGLGPSGVARRLPPRPFQPEPQPPLSPAFSVLVRLCATALVVLAAHGAGFRPPAPTPALALAATSGVSKEGALVVGDASDEALPTTRPPRPFLQRVFGWGDPPVVPPSGDEEEEPDPWCGIRLRTWQVVALVALGVYLGGWALNTLIMSALSGQAEAVVLGQEQVEEVANALVEAEKQLRYDVIMGHVPKMDDAQLMAHLREVGTHLEAEERHHMLQGAANTITDLVVGFCFTLGVLLNKVRVGDALNKVSKRFMSLSNTTQAFLLLLLSDVIVGYHSSDGWFTVLKLIGQHYGWSDRGYESIISIFVAIVPVGLDVAFKFWVFKELRRLSPSTQVILGEIDRH